MLRPTAIALTTLTALACAPEPAPEPRTFSSPPRQTKAVRPAPMNPMVAKAEAAEPVEPVQKRNASPCNMIRRAQRMHWKDCDPGLDCSIEPHDGKMAVFLHTPAEGPVVIEAHLMTDHDDLDGYWPSSARHGIKAHYRASEAATGYVMKRRIGWAPYGEGGCQFGQGSATHAVPVLAEAWYVNMFWKDRPPQGERMIVFNPRNGKAVVAAAGYETGPGRNDAIGGASEEIHHHLGTKHRESLIMGFAADQSLPFGPVVCGSPPRIVPSATANPAPPAH